MAALSHINAFLPTFGLIVPILIGKMVERFMQK